MSYICYLDNFIKQSPQRVNNEIKKLKPLKYNRFYWWRNYKSKPTLHKYNPLETRINNGDFDLSPYYWMAQKALLVAKEKIRIGQDDFQTQYEKTSIDFTRYKKLMDDFYKEEEERLKTLIKEFKSRYRISEEYIYSEIENFDGTLQEFFYHIHQKHNTYQEYTPKRGRKPKNLDL